MALPTACLMSFLYLTFLYQPPPSATTTATTNTTDSLQPNSTAPTDPTVVNVAWLTALAVQLVTFICTPLIFGQLFDGTKKITLTSDSLPIPRLPHLLLLGFLVGFPGYCLVCYSSFLYAVPTDGYTMAVLLCLIPYGLFTLQSMIVKYSAYLTFGSFMTKFMNQCLAVSSNASTLDDARACVATYHSLRSRMGVFLLFFVSIESLYVMVNSFMVYIAYAINNFSYLFLYSIYCLSAALLLMYICCLCEECSDTLKVILIPLR